MTEARQFHQGAFAPKHRAAKPRRWWQFLQRHRLTEAKAKQSLQAENRINLGKAFWDVPIRIGAGLATLAATLALVKYGGALPIGGQTLAQHLDAIVAQIPGLPGGRVVAAALDYVTTAAQPTVAAVAASYAGDRYKAGRKARDAQAENVKKAEELQKLRDRGVDVDTSPYEQLHSLKAEMRDLKDEVAELRQWKATAESQMAGYGQRLQAAYGAHLATNKRIDELAGRILADGSGPAEGSGLKPPEHDPDDPDDGIDTGPNPPPPPPPGAAAAKPDDMLSVEDSNRAYALLQRAKSTNTQETGQRASGRHRGLPPTPVQQQQTKNTGQRRR
jgi:hypothetical protein